MQDLERELMSRESDHAHYEKAIIDWATTVADRLRQAAGLVEKCAKRVAEHQDHPEQSISYAVSGVTNTFNNLRLDRAVTLGADIVRAEMAVRMARAVLDNERARLAKGER